MSEHALHRELNERRDPGSNQQRVLWWLIVCGVLALVGSLAAVALSTWRRGRIQESRIHAITELRGSVVARFRIDKPVDQSGRPMTRPVAEPNDIETEIADSSSTERFMKWREFSPPPDLVGLYSTDAPPGSVRPLIAVFGEDSFTHVTEVALHEDLFTDAHVGHLLVFPELRSLDVSHTAITDAGVQQLTALKKLERLDVSLRPLSRDTLHMLTKCRGLKQLAIFDCGADVETLRYLRQELPRCYILW